jgi:hypothetical protein
MTKENIYQGVEEYAPPVAPASELVERMICLSTYLHENGDQGWAALVDKAAAELTRKDAAVVAIGTRLNHVLAEVTPDLNNRLAEKDGEIERLKEENIAHEKHLKELVDEELEALNAEGEAFDKESCNVLRLLCERTPGFSWSDFPDGMSPDDAFEFLTSDRTETAAYFTRQLTAAQAKIAELEKALSPEAKDK